VKEPKKKLCSLCLLENTTAMKKAMEDKRNAAMRLDHENKLDAMWQEHASAMDTIRQEHEQKMEVLRVQRDKMMQAYQIRRQAVLAHRPKRKIYFGKVKLD